MTSRVRIGFVGVENIGQCAHLRNYAAVPECEVVALAELRPKLGEVVALRGEITPPCDAVEALEDLEVAREYLRLWKGR